MKIVIETKGKSDSTLIAQLKGIQRYFKFSMKVEGEGEGEKPQKPIKTQKKKGLHNKIIGK